MSERVAIIGVFDGVHRGHQAVIAQAKALAGDGEVVAITFDPHPRRVLAPDDAPAMLVSLDERVDALQDAGVDDVVVVPFTRELSQMSPAEFVQDFVVGRARADGVVVGENFRFGHRASGDVQTLRELGEGSGFSVHGLQLRGDSDRFSSTRVRDALLEGDLTQVTLILGRPFTYRGLVVHGDHRGRTLGVPTANIEVPADRAVPADGVYAGWVRGLEGSGPRMPAAISVGENPQYGGVQRRIEAHVIDRDDLDLYGVLVEVGFTHRLRGQEVFDSEGAFVEQMRADIDRARTLAGGAGAAT
ncbi:MAG TPA: bifunctional riboflavin kinase/FAD synthetase [Candidatus Nanopelagicales bacterium]|nr:bifunctional riboflavin kinase/FAD synthetase [Candidatus Nanopelagicales bacterium]